MRFGAATTLSIPGIFAFAIVLLVLRIVGAVGIDLAIHEESGAKVFLQYLLDAAAVIAVFIWLGRVQIQRLYLHALFVVVLNEVLTVALHTVIFGEVFPSPNWLVDWFVLVAAVLLGTEIGRRLRLIAEKEAEISEIKWDGGN